MDNKIYMDVHDFLFVGTDLSDKNISCTNKQEIMNIHIDLDTNEPLCENWHLCVNISR